MQQQKKKSPRDIKYDYNPLHNLNPSHARTFSSGSALILTGCYVTEAGVRLKIMSEALAKSTWA